MIFRRKRFDDFEKIFVRYENDIHFDLRKRPLYFVDLTQRIGTKKHLNLFQFFTIKTRFEGPKKRPACCN